MYGGGGRSPFYSKKKQLCLLGFERYAIALFPVSTASLLLTGNAPQIISYCMLYDQVHQYHNIFGSWATITNLQLQGV